MVSKASDDFPEPETPVKTTRRSRGMERVRSFRLCCRAPRTVIRSVGTGRILPICLEADTQRSCCQHHVTIGPVLPLRRR
jgi:hypothetical protein